MTQEQNDLFFELTRPELDAELVATEVKARLRRELMVKESEARVGAAVAAASASAAVASAAAASATAASTIAEVKARMSTLEEDNITGEVSPEVTSITLRFAGLPKEEIVRILQNKFKPINLYSLC